MFGEAYCHKFLAFIVATYGARQMIEAFLIDFFAYGSFGDW